MERILPGIVNGTLFDSRTRDKNVKVMVRKEERRSLVQEQVQGIKEIAAIKPVIDELRANDHTLALILFGSVARGDARKDSDIDLCIVTSRDIPEPDKMDLLSYGSGNIDVSFFWDLPVTIRFRVIREGKVLFCKDTLELNGIKADTVREYLDIAPLIHRHSLHAIGITNR
jgi:predicted nucleotidyltransferase